MAELAASVIAFTQAAEKCFRIGRLLLHRYQAYKHSEGRIHDLILQTEGIWFRTTVQLDVLTKVQDELSAEYLAHYDHCLATLARKLQEARMDVDKIIQEDSSAISIESLSFSLRRRDKARYSIVEKHLIATVSDLEQWYAKQFDPSFLLLIRLSSQKVDAVLQETISDNSPAIVKAVKDVRSVLQDIGAGVSTKETVFRDELFLGLDRTPVVSSNLVSTTLSQDNTAAVLLDTTIYPPSADKEQVKKHVRDLARILIRASPSTLNLLQCLGVLHLSDSASGAPQYQFIYSVPANMHTPRSLRHLLLQQSLSLDIKFAFARAIARGVATVHTAGFVHKNIRPETILVLNDRNTIAYHAFLVGFEKFRAVDAATIVTDDMVWYRNIYRHPSVQGRRPDDRYTMQHDIYSLGVCLLEIGLWHSFVMPTDPPSVGTVLEISNLLETRNKRAASIDIKKKLIKLAEGSLPACMGNTFTDLVISCLTCLDQGEKNTFAEEAELHDEDGILVGVAFIEKILLRLDAISF